MVSLKFGRSKKNAQATIELAVAMLGVFLLLYGTVATFLWLNNSVFLRQEVYEADLECGRSQAASYYAGSGQAQELPLDESKVRKLDILGSRFWWQ